MKERWRWSAITGGCVLLATEGFGRPLESLQRTHWVPLDLTETQQTTGVATGAGGSMVYISGYSLAPPGADGVQTERAFLMAYNSSGAQQWVVEYGSGVNNFGYSVAADVGGVYLAGTAGVQSTDSEEDDADDTNAFVVKYNETGGIVWEQTWGTSEQDTGNGVAVDGGSGLVYVVGMTRGSMDVGSFSPESEQGSDEGDEGLGASLSGMNAGMTDVFLTCLDAEEGDIRWTVQFGSSAADVGNSVAVGPRGGVFLVGQLGDDEDPSSRPRAFLAKYDYLGNSQFVARLNSSSMHYAVDLAPSIGSGGEGVVYMTGYTLGDDATMFLARFEGSAGTQTWLSHLGSETGSPHYAQSVTVVEGSNGGATGTSPSGSASDGEAGGRTPTVQEEGAMRGSDARVLVVGFNKSAASAEAHTSTGFTVVADTEGAWTWHDVSHDAEQETAIAVGSVERGGTEDVTAFIVGTVASGDAAPGNYHFLDIWEVLRVAFPAPTPFDGLNETLYPTASISNPIGEASATTGLSQGTSLWLLIIAPTLVVVSCILMVGYVSKQCALAFGARAHTGLSRDANSCNTYSDPDTGRARTAMDILVLRHSISSDSHGEWDGGSPRKGTLGRRPRSEGGTKMSAWPRSVVAAFRDSITGPPYRQLEAGDGLSHDVQRDNGLPHDDTGDVEMHEHGSSRARSPRGSRRAAGNAVTGDQDGLDDESPDRGWSEESEHIAKGWDPLSGDGGRSGSETSGLRPNGNPRDDEPVDGDVDHDFANFDTPQFV